MLKQLIFHIYSYIVLTPSHTIFEAESVTTYKKLPKASCTMKRTILVIFIFIFGLNYQAYCQNVYAEQSVKNTKIAWMSIFPKKKCVLLRKSNEEYETNVYEIKYFKCNIIKTNSRLHPYKLTVRIDIENWSSKEKKMFVKDALANIEEKGDRFQGVGVAEFPLTALYELEDGNWVLSTGNKRMMNFLKSARARYNTHVDISKIISIPYGAQIN